MKSTFRFARPIAARQPTGQRNRGMRGLGGIKKKIRIRSDIINEQQQSESSFNFFYGLAGSHCKPFFKFLLVTQLISFQWRRVTLWRSSVPFFYASLWSCFCSRSVRDASDKKESSRKLMPWAVDGKRFFQPLRQALPLRGVICIRSMKKLANVKILLGPALWCLRRANLRRLPRQPMRTK